MKSPICPAVPPASGRIAALAVAFLLQDLPLLAHASIDKVFSDNMVLQRRQAVPIWGTGDPGDRVTLIFRD